MCACMCHHDKQGEISLRVKEEKEKARDERAMRWRGGGPEEKWDTYITESRRDNLTFFCLSWILHITNCPSVYSGPLTCVHIQHTQTNVYKSTLIHTHGEDTQQEPTGTNWKRNREHRVSLKDLQ